MFLKQLELVGFKSFPERTKLKFEPGVTAIVGPNGCGKSNVFDSIRWVLGEQSTRALRSLKMEDIIFNGSDGKPSLGMAEVVLVFCNKARRLGVDSDEVEVSRRIFRSGESQYLLNKAPVRLKDILDLFMGTGVGAESYSLVEQGKIGLILSTRPEERRLIFDEASGITKYKTQKKEALRKLEETEQNLLRLNDIIAEVKREINSLERQANKARRYKQIFEELKSKELNLGDLEVFEIEKESKELVKKIGNSQDKLDFYQNEINNIQKQISLRTDKIQQLGEGVSRHHDQLINIDNLIGNNEQRIQINHDRQAELDTRLVDLREQEKTAEQRIQSAQQNLDNFRNEFNKLKAGIEEKQELLSKKEKQQEETDNSIHSSQEQIKQGKAEVLDLAAASSQIKNEITDLQALLRSQALRKKRLDIEKAKTREEKENLDKILKQQIGQLEEIKSQFARLKDEQSQVKQKLDGELGNQEKLVRSLQDLENEKIALQSQKEFLDELRLKYEHIDQSLNAVLYLDRLPQDDISGIMVKVKESSQSEAGNIAQNLKFKFSGEAKPIPLETDKIAQRIEKIQSEIDQEQENRRLVQQRIQELTQSLQDLEGKTRDQEILVSNKTLQVNNLTEQLNKIGQEYEVISLELEDLESQIQQLNDKESHLQAELSQATERQKNQEEEIARLENSIINLRALREKTLVDITQIKTEIENQTARLAQQDKTQAMLENTYNESKEFYQRYLDEIAQAELKIKQLSDETETLKQQNQEAVQDKIKLGEQQTKQQAEFEQLNKLQEQDNQQISLFNQNIEGVRKQIYECQIQAKELGFKQQSIRDRINQVYKADLPGQAYEHPEDKLALTSKISELKQKLDSLGTVNLIAIEEYEELKKRYDFLTQQHNDLDTARHSLNEAINKINRTTRQMFLETFKKIQVEFRNYFRLLFGEGQGQVLLTDESRPLESGIEIICRPPGKKLQNVLALSGGEKSLAAVALMFAIFKVKPAPFCVLDEVDAAMDEVNIGRFGGILQEFSRQSQFLVITHNKRTIANANVMYGVTMQEPGISKIVSVKLS